MRQKKSMKQLVDSGLTADVAGRIIAADPATVNISIHTEKV